MPLPACARLHNSHLEKWYPREIVIMVDGVHKVGKELSLDRGGRGNGNGSAGKENVKLGRN